MLTSIVKSIAHCQYFSRKSENASLRSQYFLITLWLDFLQSDSSLGVRRASVRSPGVGVLNKV